MPGLTQRRCCSDDDLPDPVCLEMGDCFPMGDCCSSGGGYGNMQSYSYQDHDDEHDDDGHGSHNPALDVLMNNLPKPSPWGHVESGPPGSQSLPLRGVQPWLRCRRLPPRKKKSRKKSE